LIHDPAAAVKTIARVFERRSPASAPLSVLVQGTNFQIAVWRALLAIPEGRLVSYRDIAAALGRPRAVRAVGSAIGSNPCGFLIPCHRVIRSNGELGGYRWGLTRKQAINAWEAAATDGMLQPC
jgi:AraC family transcriptional regulator of adaptative response/methylated-DNA-[protein]-cysteine methyltransferase